MIQKYDRGGARNFPTRELTLQTRGLKYDFQGTINAKNRRIIAFLLPTGASIRRMGALAPHPPLAAPLKYRRNTSLSVSLNEPEWEAQAERRDKSKAVLMYRIHNEVIDIPQKHFSTMKYTFSS